MVQVILHENGGVPFALVIVFVTQPRNRFHALLGMLVFGRGLGFVLARTGERGEGGTQRYGMAVRGEKGHTEGGCAVVVAITVFGIGQLSRSALGFTLFSQPVVVATGRVGRVGLTEIIISVQRHVQPLQHLELLFVSQLRHQRVGRGVARSVHPVHVGGVLGLLVLVASGETDKQAVRPRFVDDADFQNCGLVVVFGKEPADYEILVDYAVAGFAELGVVVDIDFVIVVRVVLIGIQRDIETLLRGMLRINVGLVSVERTERIGSADPGAPAVVRDDIDGSAERVAAQFDRHDALVYLHTLGQTGRNVVQPESRTHAVHRHSVDDELDVAAG